MKIGIIDLDPQDNALPPTWHTVGDFTPVVANPDDFVLAPEHVLQLLHETNCEDPVLYVATDEETGKPTGLKVGPIALVAAHAIIVPRTNGAMDYLGEDEALWTTEALQNLCDELQPDVDMAVGAMSIPGAY